MSTLPNDVLVFLAAILRDKGQLASLSSLARTSKRHYDVLTPILYRRLTITKANAESIFYGVPRKRRPPMRRPEADFAAEFQRFNDKWDRCLYPLYSEWSGYASDQEDADGDGDGDSDGASSVADYPPWSMTHDDDLGYDSQDYDAAWPSSDSEEEEEESDDHHESENPSDAQHEENNSQNGAGDADNTCGVGKAVDGGDKLPAMEIAEASLGEDLGTGKWPERLAHCRHLTFDEMPPLSLVLDLLDYLRSTDSPGNETGPTLRILFPAATHLGISPKTQRVVADYGDPLCYRRESHPFQRVLESGHLVRPQHVCLTSFAGRALRLRKIDIFRRLGTRPVS